MSDQTKATLDDAIQAHFADEAPGGIVAGYMLQIVGGSIDDYDAEQSQWIRVLAENQQLVTTLGLAHYASRLLDQIITTEE